MSTYLPLHRSSARALAQLGTFRTDASVALATTTASVHKLVLTDGMEEGRASEFVSARIGSGRGFLSSVPFLELRPDKDMMTCHLKGMLT